MAAGAAVIIPAAAAAERRFLIHISIKKGADDLLPFFMDVKKRPIFGSAYGMSKKRTAQSLPPRVIASQRRSVGVAIRSPRAEARRTRNARPYGAPSKKRAGRD